MTELKIGWSEVSITPDKKIALAGQFAERISEYVETPITATALAVESNGEQMIICSCDLVSIGENLLENVREQVKSQNSDIDTDKIILSAIHTHTSHVYDRGESAKLSAATTKDILDSFLPPEKQYQVKVSKKGDDFMNSSEALAFLTERIAKAGMAGYRDMNLYGTLYDGGSLKREIGAEIETFEMLEIEQRYNKITDSEKQAVIDNVMSKWDFKKPANPESMKIAAGYYLAVKQICDERGYDAVSLKDVDGMKKLLGFPPAPIFMLLADEAGLCTVPENDSLGCITQLMVKYLTGQCAFYLEFYEFFKDRVLAGVPDYVPNEVTEKTEVIPAAFGELSEGILNVSKVKTGKVTMCRLTSIDGEYYMHMVVGEGITPRKWEEAGWTQPAPQLPGLEILLDDVEDFADKVMCQHYIISYGDNTEKIKNLCEILGVEII